MLGICSDKRLFVSVVVPAYNEEKVIVECLESILNQTCPPDEIIVVDDGSTDKTLELIKGIDSKLIKVLKTEHRGVSFARHYGVLSTKKTDAKNIIYTTDADVVLPLDNIEKIKRHFALDEGLTAVCGGYVDKYNRPMENLMTSFSNRIFKGMGANTAYLRSSYFLTPGYNINVPCGGGSDVLFWNELTKVGKCIYDNDLKVVHKSGYRWRAIPVYTISFASMASGFLIRKRNEVIGDSLTGVGLGIGAGEIGHAIFKDSDTNVDHDYTGLVGIAGTFLLDKTNIVTNKRLINTSYGAFFGLLVHHLMTEGCSI